MAVPEPRPREALTLFYQLHRAKHNATLAALAAAGLQEVGQPRILFLLREAPEPPAQQELAQWLHVSPATVAVSLASLERAGYVERQEDGEDRRKKRIALTDKGRTACSRCIQVFEQVDDQLCAGFTPEELDQLSAQFRRMLDNLGTTGKDDCL